MSLSQLIFWFVIICIVLILIIFPGARSLLKGLIGVFIKDMATTPEGATAIYNEKIEESQDKYRAAHDALQKAVGNLSTARNDMENLKIRLSKAEQACEALVKNNKLEEAQLKVEEREEILMDIDRTAKLIAVYEKNERDAKEIFAVCEKQLRDIKRESKNVVQNMKVKQQLKEAYDDMDELKKNTSTDKLLDSIREKNKDLDAIVEGSRVVHENKLSTRLQRADAEAKKVQSNDYLESLKKKYNK